MSSLRGIWVVPGPCRRSGPPSRKPGWSAPSQNVMSPSTTWGLSSHCRGRTGGEPPSMAFSMPSGELEQSQHQQRHVIETVALTQCQYQKCELITTCAICCQGETLYHFSNMVGYILGFLIKLGVSQSLWFDASRYALYVIRYLLCNWAS